MKKILFTFIALFAIVVACEKDMVGAEENGINPIVPAVEASVDFDIDGITGRLNSIANNIKSFSPKDNSTARTVGGHITLVSQTSNGIYSEYLFSDDVTYCNTPSGADEIFLVLNGTSTEIRVGAVSGSGSILLATITTDFSFLYGVTIAEGLKFNLTSGNFQVVDGSGVPNFDFTEHSFADADFRCATNGWHVNPSNSEEFSYGSSFDAGAAVRFILSSVTIPTGANTNVTAHLGTFSGTSTSTTLINQARATRASALSAMQAITE